MARICLDAGHGGEDTGAVGPTGLEEATVVLNLCEMIGPGLESIGQEVWYTRTSDKYISLAQRCQISNEWGSDLFVSCHLNSNGPDAVGVETLYVSNAGMELALPIQQSLIERTGDKDRGVKIRTNLYVLNGTDCPAVLVESGFVSNPATETKFKTGSYQLIVANAIVVGIANYLGIQPAKLK